MAYQIKLGSAVVECDTADEAMAVRGKISTDNVQPGDCAGHLEPAAGDGQAPTIKLGTLELRLCRCCICGRKAYLSPALDRCPQRAKKAADPSEFW